MTANAFNLMAQAVFAPMGYDETHAECAERVRREDQVTAEFGAAVARQQPDYDDHARAWRVAMWEMAEEVAWRRRQGIE